MTKTSTDELTITCLHSLICFKNMSFFKLDKSDLENLGKNVKGLRKDDVANMTADDLADSLGAMNDTFSQVIDTMDKITVDSIISKVNQVFRL